MLCCGFWEIVQSSFLAKHFLETISVFNTIYVWEESKKSSLPDFVLKLHLLREIHPKIFRILMNVFIALFELLLSPDIRYVC